MSPSLLLYEERSEPFRDVDLFAVTALLEHFVEQGQIDHRLSGLVSSWKSACVMNSGPGTIDFDFSALDADPPLAMDLRCALVWVEAEIERLWSPAIPAAILNRYDPGEIEFKEFPVGRMTAAIRSMRRVVGDGGDANVA